MFGNGSAHQLGCGGHNRVDENMVGVQKYAGLWKKSQGKPLCQSYLVWDIEWCMFNRGFVAA